MEKFAVRSFVNIQDSNAYVELIGESGYVIPKSKLTCHVVRPADIFRALPQEIGKRLMLSHGVQVTRNQNGYFACMVEPEISGFAHEGQVAYAMLRQLMLACSRAKLAWFYIVTKEPDLQQMVHKLLGFEYLAKDVGGLAILDKSLPVPESP